MRFYWDTSAAINAFFAPSALDRLKTDEHVTRTHTLSEFFSVMTGSGIALPNEEGRLFEVVLTPRDAARWLRGFVTKVKLTDLDGPELVNALEQAEAREVHGQGVYDYGHFVTAQKAKADVILTRDVADFRRLAAGTDLRVEWP